MAREPIPAAVQEEVLTRSARRCALCFGLKGSLERMKGQIAHLDRNSANPKLDNLAYLCLEHHDEYDTSTRQSKGLVPEELLAYRKRLYDAIAAGQHHQADAAAIRRTEIAPVVLEHDRDAFRKGDAILPESKLYELLDQLAGDHSFYSGRSKALYRFREHFSLESNRFVVADVLAPLDELNEALRELAEILGRCFFTYPSRQNPEESEGYRLCLYPDLNMERGGTYSPEGAARYHEAEAQLRVATSKVEDAYREYRRTVKRTLLV